MASQHGQVFAGSFVITSQSTPATPSIKCVPELRYVTTGYLLQRRKDNGDTASSATGREVTILVEQSGARGRLPAGSRGRPSQSGRAARPSIPSQVRPSQAGSLGDEWASAYKRRGLIRCSHVVPNHPRMERRWNARAGKREHPEKTRWQAASSSTIPTRENPVVNPLGIEPGSPWWEASALATNPQDFGKAGSNREQSNEEAPECKSGVKLEISEENPSTSGIVRHDSHLRKSGSDPAED
ncbi:hypothetical protein PR048_000228 [Dryococelus australis]|uniref:Uncharacterized protein n=1 Tax=Dryococelus australis TaxID=614101 RepID=A0ABQ9IEY7_9NEOP|nr:hypothetical protein PR048_000228 [Dryococelus australis]